MCSQKIEWHDISFPPINLWSVPCMTPKQVVEFCKTLETEKKCLQQCRLDVWRERCISCNQTINEIKEAYARTKREV